MMIKILFILPSLKAGGAERVVSFICQRLNPLIFDVTLIVNGFQKDQVFKVENVRLIFLNKSRFISSIPKLIYYIHKLGPKIVFSSIGHINLFLGLLSIFYFKTIFVAREASIENIMSKYYKKKQPPLLIRKVLYSRLDKIIFQSQDMKINFESNYKLRENRAIVINNPITFNFTNQVVKDQTISKRVKFITVGRLSNEKGHERILRNLSQIKIDFSYLIIGDGPLKSNIIELVKKLNLEGKVEMVDYTDDVGSFLLKSDFFLQGSYVEGFPNSLLESLSLGLPCIAFDAPGGTREIVLEGFNGFIVNSDQDFKNAISKAIKYSWNNVQIKEDVFDRFGPNKILNNYESLFLKLVK